MPTITPTIDLNNFEADLDRAKRGDVDAKSRLHLYLDEVLNDRSYTDRGLVKVQEIGLAVAIVKLAYPHEIQFLQYPAKAHPTALRLWTPSWIVDLFRAGAHDEIPRCITDEDYRLMCLDGLTAIKALKAVK